jgi:Mn-dependent DtxR family transcriptional regulator
VRELAKVGLVRHEPYGRIELTTEGNAAGEAVARRDSCLTRLLVEVLDMSPEAADPEVHRLEHFVSDEVTWRLETLVRFALSSEGWVKRLHHRLRAGHPGSEVAGPHRVGETRIHKGPDVEKTRLDLP